MLTHEFVSYRPVTFRTLGARSFCACDMNSQLGTYKLPRRHENNDRAFEWELLLSRPVEAFHGENLGNPNIGSSVLCTCLIRGNPQDVARSDLGRYYRRDRKQLDTRGRRFD